MKTLNFNDFLSKKSKNSEKIIKNKQKRLKSDVFKALIIAGFLLAFGVDILKIAISFIGFLISSLISTLNSVY